MLSLQEREAKKGMFAKRTSENLKKYADLYEQFCESGYSKMLASEFAEYFVIDAKKPAVGDIVQTARLYNKIRDYSMASYYLDKVFDVKKLGGDERFFYCIEALTNKSLVGNWRDAEDFRTEHIAFLQKYSDKLDIKKRAELYIALAYSDCAAKEYSSAFRLLKGIGYKPQGKNDVKLVEILTTVVYIAAKSGDAASTENAVNNARAALNLIKKFEFDWSKDYYEKLIADAAMGI